MRSTEEMKQLVRREATRRRRRRRAAVLGAVGAVALVLIGLTTTGADPDRAAEVSTADAPGQSSTSPSVTIEVPPAPADVEPPELLPGLSSGAPEADPTGASGPGSSSPVATAPVSAPATNRDPDDDADPGPPPDGPAATTPSTVTATTAPAPTSTTTSPPRPCTDADFHKTELWFQATDSTDLAPFTARVGAETNFGYSFWLDEGVESCTTPDSLMVVTVTDAGGHEVLRHTLDEGPGRVITPGMWPRFSWALPWNPTCVDMVPLPGWGLVCEPAGIGTYVIRVYDQGVTYGPLSIQLVADR